MAEPLSLTPRVRVVAPPHPFAGVPIVGNRGSLACLEVDGQPMLQGNRSRVVLLGWQVVALLRRIDEDGKGERPIVRVLAADGGAKGEGASEWTPTLRGRLHHVSAFGAELVAVHIGDEPTPLVAMPIPFEANQPIKVHLAAVRPQDAPVLVLLSTELRSPVIRRAVRAETLGPKPL